MIFDAFRKLLGSGGTGHGQGGDGASIPPCEEALSRLYEFLDGELDDVTTEQVEAHFEACRRCYPHLACERAFKAALRRAIEGRHAPSRLRREVLRLLEDVAEEG
jgi:anti-sigma factor (TIGR02949 family)